MRLKILETIICDVIIIFFLYKKDFVQVPIFLLFKSTWQNTNTFQGTKASPKWYFFCCFCSQYYQNCLFPLWIYRQPNKTRFLESSRMFESSFRDQSFSLIRKLGKTSMHRFVLYIYRPEVDEWSSSFRYAFNKIFKNVWAFIQWTKLPVQSGRLGKLPKI